MKGALTVTGAGLRKWYMKQKLQEQMKRLKSMPKWQRVTVGLLLVVGGTLGALPVLGFWMIPLGLALLAVDFAWARRANTNFRLWVRNLRARWKNRA